MRQPEPRFLGAGLHLSQLSHFRGPSHSSRRCNRVLLNQWFIGYNLLMVCPPGAGKSVLAAPLPGIPFCAALALHREARDPEFFDETALRDPQNRGLCRRVRLVPEAGAGHAGMAGTVTVALADGRRLEGRAENGMLESGELGDKFLRLTRRALGEPGATALYERLQKLEDERSLDWLS